MEVKAVWTAEEDQYLKDNWLALSAKVIGDKLSRSRNSVIGRANRIGLKKAVSSTKKDRKIHLGGKVGDIGSEYDAMLKRIKSKKGLPRLPKVKNMGFTKRTSMIWEEKDPSNIEDEPFLGVHLLDVRSGQCRYMKDPQTMLFCGHQTKENTPYCTHHAPYMYRGKIQLDDKDQKYYRRVK